MRLPVRLLTNPRLGAIMILLAVLSGCHNK